MVGEATAREGKAMGAMTGEERITRRQAFRLGAGAVATLGLGSALSGCASEARSTAMVAPVTDKTLVSAGNPLRNAVILGGVRGGEQTNPLWTSEVSGLNFRRALDTSLRLATLRAPTDAMGPGRYLLEATLEEVDQPQIAINFEVTVTALYQLRSQGGALLYNERVTSPYTAKFTDSLVRAERLRLANEGAVKLNISTFLERLVADSEKDPYRYAAG